MSNHRLVIVPVLVGLAAAFWTAAERIAAERRDVVTECVCEYADVTALAAYAHRPLEAALAALKEKGLTGVAVDAPTVRELVDTGVLSVQAAQTGGSWLSQPHESAMGRSALTAVCRRLGVPTTAASGLLPAPPSALMDLSAGLDPDAAAAVKHAGLDIVARLRNEPGLDPEGLEAVCADAQQLHARLVLFAGDQVLGFRDLIPETAQALADHKLHWARIEFGEQKGEDRLAEAILAGDAATGRRAGSYLRLHSITAGELAKHTPGAAIERLRRAAKERDIRVLFVRLRLGPSANELETNGLYLQQLRDALVSSGLKVGHAEPAAPRRPSRLMLFLLGAVGVASAGGWLLALLTGEWTTCRWLWGWAALALAPLPLMLLAPSLYSQVMGLLAGLVFPTLAGWWACRQVDAGRLTTTARAVALPWITVGVAVTGALLAAGLLTSTPFMLHHKQFAGVKLTQILPLVVVAFIAGAGLGLPGVRCADVAARLRALRDEHLTVGNVTVALIVLVILIVFVARSGNEGLEVSATELRFRDLLEHVFGARPRTKEFLFGDPALLLAGLAAMRGRRAAALCLLVVGMVGVVSAFNTFCHLHTPLTQSLLRTFHALWLATLLALAADAIYRRLRHA